MEFQEEIKQKKGKEKIVMLTAYDYQTAKILDKTDIDLILVGDSLGMAVQGHSDTKKVTMRDMIYHTKIVARGVKSKPIVGDMPINSYNNTEDSIRNAKRFLDAGAHGVKIEGKQPKIIQALIEEQIPVMGHVGLLPQKAKEYRLKGKEPSEAEKICRDSIYLDNHGVFSIVLECVPEALAAKITSKVKTPTIGIGAGKYCDGQVLIINDLLGLDDSFKPKFVKRYAQLKKTVKDAVATFIEEVRVGDYPDPDHTYH
ncbi:MAG: 3-methyl-2-oxobutanoate hydroxymethyltransferase [Candidatus Bathyarchaeota archaeon]|jgi:3-methyl-2-oxobutanoate hydroxymethyltransferase